MKISMTDSFLEINLFFCKTDLSLHPILQQFDFQEERMKRFSFNSEQNSFLIVGKLTEASKEQLFNISILSVLTAYPNR